MIKARWVYSIVLALEARLEYVKDMTDNQNEEEKAIEEALKYFDNLEV